MKVLLSLFMAILVLTGCYAYEPAPVDRYDFQGDWQGTIQDSTGGTGTLSVTIDFQSGGDFEDANLGGRWEADFGENGTSNGIIQGSTYDYENLYIFLNPESAINCGLRPSTVREGDEIKAIYDVVDNSECLAAGFGQGSFTLRR